ncbi:uncharacterized protein LOC142888808 [Nelusetta ayraudi]|uniref:uncharacterized protein LOC142888808 n=1 Tax=Nelusetta ayraudi TaxID=303726 RepID=UPI003F711A8A
MSLRVKSHTDLQAAGTPSLGGGLHQALSMSSGSLGRVPRFGSATTAAGEVRGHPAGRPRRPVRVVRPVSTNNSFLHMNNLQGELVRKRKECEDLRKENKFLANEIHMERITMRTENELIMRNLRNLNQELQADVKELKHRLHQSQQRATLCSQAAAEAEESRGEAERSRALAEARAGGWQRDSEAAEGDRCRLSEELQLLKKELGDLQLSLARAEKSHLEAELQLRRLSAEKQALQEEQRSVEKERSDLRQRLRRVSEEKGRVRESEADLKHRVAALEQENQKARQAQQECEAERCLAERERQERSAECLSWRERHGELAQKLRAQEDLRALRQSKACQANIKSYFLCMTESDQRVKILRNQDGAPRNFTEGDPVFISTPEPAAEEPERSSSRTMLRVSAPHAGRTPGPSHFDELPAFVGQRPDSAPQRRSRKVVEYFWIPTDQE